jgi:hypothetical protein
MNRDKYSFDCKSRKKLKDRTSYSRTRRSRLPRLFLFSSERIGSEKAMGLPLMTLSTFSLGVKAPSRLSLSTSQLKISYGQSFTTNYLTKKNMNLSLLLKNFC